MIGIEDAPYTFEYDKYYKILPMINDWYNSNDRIKDGTPVEKNFNTKTLMLIDEHIAAS